MSTNLSGPETAPPPLPPAAAGAGRKPPKNPGLAALFSLLFPGVGQVYNAQPARALVFFSAFAASIYATAEISPLPFALFIPFVYIYNVVDAWRGASLINARLAGGAPKAEEEMGESPAWGGSLVAIGLVLLFNNLGWFDLAALRRYWPLLLVAAGVALIYGSLRKRKASGKADAGGV
jgi:TM2 domain-containing membrane protein YozV